jgi:nucleoside-diphosphate-sugar epimerase
MSSTLPAAEGARVRRWQATQGWRETAAILRGIDAVVHAAAHIPPDQADPDEARTCLEVNALGTLNLLRAAENAGLQRFIFISTANVLKPQARPVSEDDPIGGEQAPYYLGSKVVAEVFVRSFRERGLRTLILRPSSIYGPGTRGGVLSTFADRLRAGEPIVLHHGGRYRADYVWRADVVGLVGAAVDSDRVGEVNVGSGRATPLTEVAAILCRVLRADPRLIVVEPDGATALVGAGFSAVDITRAQQWFGFQPMGLAEGLERWLGNDG